MIALIAFSIQAAYALNHGLNASRNPNVEVPVSSVPRWFDRGRVAHTHHLIWRGDRRSRSLGPLDLNLRGPLLPGPTIEGFSPEDVRGAYGVPDLSGSQAIAIVSAYFYPTALNDFNVFSSQFGLPVETSTDPTASSNQVFQMVYQGNAQPPEDEYWSSEQAMQIEWAHSIAPNAKIYLVEAQSSAYVDLFRTESLAGTLPNVKEVSSSWGGKSSRVSRRLTMPSSQRASYFS